jgi:hypothetical protein
MGRPVGRSGARNPLDLPSLGPYVRAVQVPPGDDERFEHIPWDQIAPSGSRLKVSLYALAGAILIAGLTAAIVRGGGATTGLVPTPTTVTLATATTLVEVATPSTTAPGGAPIDTPPEKTQPQVWSEADLMAFPAETLAAEAAAVAEWLASDFFTIDGGTQIAADLKSVFPEGSSLPAAPSGARSFVEWARAVSVEGSGPGRYDVLVVVRRLGAADGENYARIPPVGLVITLSWTERGWSVTDLPVLAEAPPLIQAPAWPHTEVPAEVIAPVVASTGGKVLEGIRVGEAWRLVVQLDDPTGASWPMVIWSDSTGNRIPVPAQPVQP